MRRLLVSFSFTTALAIGTWSTALAASSAGSPPRATTANSSKPTVGPLDGPSLDAHAKTLADARDFARKGDVDATERALRGLIRAGANTPEGHGEMASRLASVAGGLAREGHSDAVGAVVARALSHLDQAKAAASAAKQKARYDADAAFLYETFVGDIPMAITRYQAALQADPANKVAQAQLARLQDMDANLRAKIQAAKAAR